MRFHFIFTLSGGAKVDRDTEAYADVMTKWGMNKISLVSHCLNCYWICKVLAFFDILCHALVRRRWHKDLIGCLTISQSINQCVQLVCSPAYNPLIISHVSYERFYFLCGSANLVMAWMFEIMFIEELNLLRLISMVELLLSTSQQKLVLMMMMMKYQLQILKC